MNVRDLNRVIAKCCAGFRPPEDLTVSEWADKHRRLSREASAEAGPWRTSRTPYLKEPMDAVTDPNVERITVMSSAQIGKTEFELNVLAYIIDQDPGPVLFIQPTVEDARGFSRTRISTMIRDSAILTEKVEDIKRGRGNNDKTTATVLQKSFPGGSLTIIGSNSASSLSSKPIRFVLGDERDRWPLSAGEEGDPWDLAVTRTETFYNRKLIEVSTPTIKGVSVIADAYELGTQETWCHRCPHCGEWSRIVFGDVRFKAKSREVNGRKVWDIDGEPEWMCPHCGALSTETEMRDAPQRWIAENPSALEARGHRSFRINAFASPWASWRHIILRFLDAKDDPEKLKVVYNTLFGELWEDRGDVATEEEMMDRREDYGEVDGMPVELPDGVLVLTCGVDVQDNRLEYEVLGHGQWGETWGIEYGRIMGRPDDVAVWAKLDDLVGKGWRYADGKMLKISLTCVDSGGHFTQDVYEQCRRRYFQRVVPIKGFSGEGRPYVGVPSEVATKDKLHKVRLYAIGVDSGKATIMDNLRVETPGPKYCHFPLREEAGYDITYFEGLLSEHLVRSKTARTKRMTWEIIPGHRRNEPLDCRNYAMAAIRILNPPWDRLKRARTGEQKPKRRAKRTKKRRESYYDGW